MLKSALVLAILGLVAPAAALLCGPGQYANFRDECMPCAANTYQHQANQDACRPCPPGGKSLSGMNRCCGAGTYPSQDRKPLGECVICDPTGCPSTPCSSRGTCSNQGTKLPKFLVIFVT